MQTTNTITLAKFEKPGDWVKPNADIGIRVLMSVGDDFQLF
jgi:hypothetical protein